MTSKWPSVVSSKLETNSSAGFDACAQDPIAQETLEPEDFHWLGQQLRGFDLPLFSVLEGGYSHELPELVFAYLKGVAGN